MSQNKKIKWFIFSISILLIIPLIEAATIQGTIYNKNLDIETNILLSINTTPTQQLLVKEGDYSINASPGTYLLYTRKGNISTSEIVTIDQQGTFTHDIFLVPTLTDEEDLWNDIATDENITDLTTETETKQSIFSYIILAILLITLLIRVIYYRKKYGSLRLFRKKIKEEQHKTTEQLKAEIADEPTILDKTLEIIKKNDGRMYQTELRKELNYLSEAKVSLIITELEHKQRIEKIKKGRGNIIILKEQNKESTS